MVPPTSTVSGSTAEIPLGMINQAHAMNNQGLTTLIVHPPGFNVE
jgi:hypothetical protein